MFTFSGATLAQNIQISALQPGTIVGTVTDANNDPVAEAKIDLEGTGVSDRVRVVSSENGYFEFHDVKPGVPYRVTVSADGFADWHSSVLILEPSQFKILADIQLRIMVEQTTVNVTYDPVQVATEQVKIEEQQRILGFIPNYYVVYEPNAAPLTPKLKFDLAFKTLVNPVTVAGVALLSGAQQAGNTPDYGQGAEGFGKRFGANTAGGFVNIMVGGAILPSLLHQDPRYFYQGTGSTGSRARHAVFHAFICKGDNGNWQPNYSTIGGDMASSALANAYYPKSNRGVGLFLSHFAMDTAERVGANLAQEFLLRRLTHKPRTGD
ncbi:MAG TPA: carboxypeptidase-like regulatory domain-containing protein [Dongiaceae bacterium]|nr:carboxypeptidase-like regulatory domain-containing protein [Dongiaceae bacterium]